ncbi:MAG: hypothetical protein K0B37_14685 [Bacteroidales bacterium]|nr:hypothetical protein [Bacteroidales bacterium]
MIQLSKQNILEAFTFIDKNGVPSKRRASKYNLYYNHKHYPPKYVLSIASKIATGIELLPSQFNGGKQTNNLLTKLGFTIRAGRKTFEASKPKAKTIRICTALFQIQSNNWDKIINSNKIGLLSNILSHLPKETDILVLPAGFLNSISRRPETIFNETEKGIIKLIKKFNTNLFICLGIDGRNKTDQLALTITSSGIVAIARKFHHNTNSVDLAENAFALEHNKQRQFLIKGKRPYLAVCYDIFGISRLKLVNEINCDFIIGVIHGFDNKRRGDSDFARKGLAGASKQWGVHTYASAVFQENRNPTNWPSGVKWKHGNASVKGFKYDQIKISSDLHILPSEIATVYMRYYVE